MKPVELSNFLRFGTELCRFIFLVIAVHLLGSPALATTVAEPDLLEPQHAFQLSARYEGTNTLELMFKIANGYYMYKPRFKFAIDSGPYPKLGKPIFTKGQQKQDPTFGRVEIYRDSVRILLPFAKLVQNMTSADASFRLKVTSQGCADVGVCYPPQIQYLSLAAANSDVVLPDGAKAAGIFVLDYSKPADAQPTLSEALRKPK